jgi:hypothetical protein
MSPQEFLDYLNNEKIRLGGIIPQTYTDGVPNLLHNEIMVWLQDNKDLSHEDRLQKIKLTLFERTEWHELHHYAAMSFIIMERLLNECNELQGHIMTGVKGGKEIAEHLESERRTQVAQKGAFIKNKDNRDRADKIRKIWATGKYTSRDICAEQEYNALGFGSFKAARNALKNTPNPTKNNLPSA